MFNITNMPLPSKQDRSQDLFFSYPQKKWSFGEILKEAGISRPNAAKWLSRLEKRKLVSHIKEKGEFPYFIARESAEYENEKRAFALEKLYASGLLSFIYKEKVDVCVLFGSYSRSDWNAFSDVDLFILGNIQKHRFFPYEQKLGREIHLFIYRNVPELMKINKGLWHNILEGYFLMGRLSDATQHIPHNPQKTLRAMRKRLGYYPVKEY